MSELARSGGGVSEGKGADLVAATLRQHGVEVVFGLPGVHNLEFWRACADQGIRMVGARHEQGAAYAADGFARTTGELGVVFVTTGPGAANTLGAVGEAWAAHSPVLVIATDIPAAARRPGAYRGVLHECRDQAGMFAPVTKHATLAADPAGLSADVATAIAIATAAPAGPTYLGVPTDFLKAAVDPIELTPPPAPADATVGGGSWIEDLRAHLDGAERPLIWVGSGARRAGEQVGMLAERLGAPVVETVQGRGIVPSGHPWLVGMPLHEPAVSELVEESDLLLAIGTDLDAMGTQNWALRLPRPRIAINVDAVDAGKNYEMGLIVEGDAAALLDRLLAELGAAGPSGTLAPADLAALRERVRDDHAADPNTSDVFRMVEMIGDRLPDDSLVFTDMAIIGYWLSQYLPARRPISVQHPAWGTLGFAFPASIGAAVADRGPTFVFCGDGGILFALGELAAVRQENLPVKVVVFDDGGYGVLRWAHPPGDQRFGTDLEVPDFARIAAGFGIEATSVDGIGEELERALVAAIAHPGPSLLHVKAEIYPPPTTSARWPLRERASAAAGGAAA